MRQFPSLLIVGLICAIDWQTPDGVIHTGALVYPEDEVQAFVVAQQTEFPTYTFSVRCE